MKGLAQSRVERREQLRRLVLAPVGRWTPHRKLRLCMALRGAVISHAEAIAAHGLSADELALWHDAVARRDFEALRAGQRRVA